jgi:hypothetical protein
LTFDFSKKSILSLMPQKYSRHNFIRNLSFGAAALSPGISYLTADTMYKTKGKLAANKKLLPGRNSDRNACQRAGVG